jgi:7-carboxy-7-deazaguanine synthase (Cx14CxxC type)
LAKTYSVKEIFYTLQGEGFHAGRPAVFCRFAGCNLWSGREVDRVAAVCQFCDTDFVGTDGQNGGKFTSAEALAKTIADFWPDRKQGQPFVVITGGEPALQMDSDLIDALHNTGFEIAIETNGTLPLPKGIDWVCVSPKGSSEITLLEGHELKLVYPQKELRAQPEQFQNLQFKHFYIQPLDDQNALENRARCIEYCMQNPQWKLSIQTHKILDID